MSAELKRRIVRRVGLQAAVAACILAVACAGSARADDRAAASKGSVQAKLSYCKDCHGPSAQGYHGFYPIPRLAGQQPEYLENQLRAFTEHRRTNNIMFNVAHALSPGMEAALAEHFRNLNPKPAADGPRQLVGEGKRIFEDGVPDSNIAACAACHGPEATGVRQIPRLAGQLYPYLIKELTDWGKERGQNAAKPDTSAVMIPIAHSLSRGQVEAVAAYVSQLR
jgi:cytochrome c553